MVTGAPVQRDEDTEVPVKVVIERRVRRGAEAEFTRWVQRFVASAGRSVGHEGASVLTAANGLRFVLLRFRSAGTLDLWHTSPEFRSLMQEADAVSAAGDPPQVRSGLETWFTLPDMPAPAAPPPRWKMALLTWACLLPMVIALAYAFAPLELPFLLQAALSTAIPVVMLTWVVMPRVTRALYAWLYVIETRVVSTNHLIS